MSTTVGQEYLSQEYREIAAEFEGIGRARGEEIGRARGEAEAVLSVLDGRGIPVPEPVRAEITACSDLAQLKTWLLRAVTATTAEDLIAD